YSEDIPFGLATWAKFASHLNIEAPVMDSLVTLGSSILEKDCWSMGPSTEDLGLKDLNIQQIKAFIE
ncbi:NAD/NADP octopine/nopaline dehydrogenase family protein, partial [Erysipelothrix rhusiopathiae]|nr:NAD/NADP octopine/nopaline dehydrogenase family protein [Erysipelothrix rhusiopathiae]